MKPPPFDYHRPGSVAEAIELLDGLEDAKVIAGGQSLVPLMNYRLAAPAHLVDISRLDELGTITVDDGAVVVGATVTHTALLNHSGATEAIPLLCDAEQLIAHEVIRNRGTVCGSLAHADPAGELTAVLALLEGSVRAASTAGERDVAAVDLFDGPLQTSLAENELVLSARFPRPPGHRSTSFREMARRHGDYAICGVATAVDRGAGGRLDSARAAFICVAPTPLVVDLTPVVAGRGPGEIDRGDVYDFVVERVDPADDIHATADYRRHLAGVLAGQGLEAAL